MVLAGRPAVVKVRSTRLVSFTQRAIAAIAYEVEPVDEPARLIIQSELVANEHCRRTRDDPRVAAALEQPARSRGALVRRRPAPARAPDPAQRTAHGGRHGPRRSTVPSDVGTDRGARTGRRLTVACVLKPGERLRVVKFLAYGWSAGGRCPPCATRSTPRSPGPVHRLGRPVAEQREYLDGSGRRRRPARRRPRVSRRSGSRCSSAAGRRRAERRAIPAKGLSGPGYDGHVFWDTEMFVLPVLTYTAPRRSATSCAGGTDLGLARERAAQLGLAARRSRGARSAARSARVLAGRHRGVPHRSCDRRRVLRY